METSKLLLWLGLMAVAMLEMSCAVIEGTGNGNAKGCVVGPPHDCSHGNHSFTCRQILRQPENGGKKCPPQIEITGSRPAEHFEPCDPGPWGPCEPLSPAYPGIWIRRRAPLDPTSDISTCPPMIMLCNFNLPVDCVMTDWSEWYYFPTLGIRVRVRFVLIAPQNGGAACPHDFEMESTGGPSVCVYGLWNDWTDFGGTCYRWRSTSDETSCTDTLETKPPPCVVVPPCTYGLWSVWIPQGAYCRRYRTTSNAIACPHITETIPQPCGPVVCTYGLWSVWIPQGTFCRRYRTTSDAIACPHITETIPQPCGPVTCVYGLWTAWAESGGLCHRSRTASHATCPDTSQTKPLPCDCVYTDWSVWKLIIGDRCHRWRTSSDPSCTHLNELKAPPCDIGTCAPPEPIGDAGIVEGPVGSRKKRDLPWCPEERYQIFGREPGGCTADEPVYWFKCVGQLCQDCPPPAGKTLICIPSKFTKLVITMTCTSGASPRTFIVWRPQSCMCHEDVTCIKFTGPCA